MQQPDPIGTIGDRRKAARSPACCGALASGFATPSYTISWDTTIGTPLNVDAAHELGGSEALKMPAKLGLEDLGAVFLGLQAAEPLAADCLVVLLKP